MVNTTVMNIAIYVTTSMSVTLVENRHLMASVTLVNRRLIASVTLVNRRLIASDTLVLNMHLMASRTLVLNRLLMVFYRTDVAGDLAVVSAAAALISHSPTTNYHCADDEGKDQSGDYHDS